MPFALGCSLFTPSACVASAPLQDFFFSLTGHPAPRLYELSQFCLHMHFFPDSFSAQSLGWEIGEPTTIKHRNNSMLTHMFLSLPCFFYKA